MLIALIAGSMMGTMPVAQFAPRMLDVSQASVLAATTAPMVTWADLFVDTAGRVGRCTTAVSSGSSLVDRVACDRAMRFARFVPARDEDGQPVAALVRQGFAVNRAMPPPEVDFALTVDRAPPGAVADLRVVADPAGKVLTCAIDRSSGVAALDTLACDAVFGVVRTVVRDASGVPVRGMSRASVGFVSGAIATR